MSSQKWSQFPAATILQDADLLAIVQSGINKKISSAALQSLLTKVPSDAILCVANDILAAEGYLGEIIDVALAPGSGPDLSSGSIEGICSLVLTPGDWDICAFAGFVGTSLTVTDVIAGVCEGDPSELGTYLAPVVYEYPNVTSLNQQFQYAIPTFRKQVPAATTYTMWLAMYADFSAGTMAAYGGISARRMR